MQPLSSKIMIAPVYFAFASVIATTLGILIKYRASFSARSTRFRRIPRIKPPGSGKVTSRIAGIKPFDFDALQAYAAEPSVEPTDSTEWQSVFRHVSSRDFKAHCEGIYPITLNDEPCEELERIRQSRLQRALVQRNADFIANLHLLAAQDVSEFRYISDRSRPQRTYFAELTSLMGLLACEMLLCIEDRKCSRVLTCLETQIHLLTLVPSTNPESNSMYRMVMERSLIGHIRKVLNSNILDHAHLKQLIDYLQTLPGPARAWQQAIVSHRARSIQLMQNEFALERYRWPDEKNRGGFNKAKLQNLLDAFQRYENVNLCNWKTAKSDLMNIRQDIPDNIAVESSLDLLHMAAESIAYTQSSKNLAILACALYLYRSEHNRFPDQLAQLTDIGLDMAKYASMSGQPFGYHCQNQTAYLWGPVLEANDHFSLEILPTLPTLSPSMTREDRRRIEDALWVLNS